MTTRSPIIRLAAYASVLASSQSASDVRDDTTSPTDTTVGARCAHLASIALLLLSLLALCVPADAQCAKMQLTASDAGKHYGEYFGSSLSSDGQRVIVGRPGKFGDVGAAYIIDLQTGSELVRLTPSDANSSRFGQKVTLQGPHAIVSTSDDYIYVYDSLTGSERFKLRGLDTAPGDLFGQSLAISGDLAVVGAPNKNLGAGAVYTFDLNDGQQTGKIIASDAAQHSTFGVSIDVSGDLLIVGSGADDDMGPQSGSVYIIDLVTGSELGKLHASDAEAYDFFGSSVATDGTALVATAHRNSLPAVYAFDVATQTQLRKITPVGVGQVWAVDVLDSIALLGCSSAYNYAGSMLQYDLPSGALVNQKISPDWADSQFGAAVGFAGNDVIVGAPVAYLLTGVVFVFDSDGSLIGARECSATQNSSGNTAAVWACGSSLISDNSLILATLGAARNQYGYYLMSATDDFIPNFGGSYGNLCLGGKIIRLNRPSEILFGGESGILYLPVDVMSLPQDITFLPGETWRFQAWFRDIVGSEFTSNTSDAVAIQWR